MVAVQRPVVLVLRPVPAPLPGRAAGRRRAAEPVRGRPCARSVVPAEGRLPLRGAAAGCRRAAAARRVRHPDQGGLLPALRRGDGGDAPNARDPGARRGRVHERDVRRQEVDRNRPRCPCLGRGLVPGPRLGAVRPDARAWHLRGRLLVRLELGGGRRGARARRPQRHHTARAAGSGQRRHPTRADGRREPRPPSFAVAIGLGALWVTLVGLGKAALRRARYLTRDPRRAATASRRDSRTIYATRASHSRPGPLDDLQRAVYQELGVDAKVYADVAARGRFGRPGDVDQGAENARTELRAVLRRARDRLSLWARFRGLVSLRSFRRGWTL